MVCELRVSEWERTRCEVVGEYMREKLREKVERVRWTWGDTTRRRNQREQPISLGR